jgi:hypothetical protein
MRSLICLTLFSLTLAPAALPASEVGLTAGVATADITPAPGLRMWGYSNRTQGATGKLDPLMARALVLKVAEHSVAIVTLDLGRVPEPHVLDRVRRQVRERCGLANLLITASHTHAAPSMEGGSDELDQFSEHVGDAIVLIVCDAAGQLQPVALGIGRGEADLAHNRRKFLPDGRVAMQWRNVEHEPTEPIDKQFVVIRLDHATGDNAGKPLATLVHYACHPVVLGPDNLQYSADFVGAACKRVRAESGAPCLYLQGACGNINPYVDKTPLADGGVREMQQMGCTLGDLVLAASKTIDVKPLKPATIQFDTQVIPVRTRWDIDDPEVRAVLSKAYGPRFDNYLLATFKDNIIPCTLTTLKIGDSLALVGMPGEVFVQFQHELTERSPVPNTLLVGYTEGYHAYFPTIRDAAAGGYGGKTATYVEVGAGERLTNAALVELYHMTDKLHDRPREQDFKLLEYDEVRGK